MTDSEPTRRCSAADFDPRTLPALSPLAADLLALDIDDDQAEKQLSRVVDSDPQLSVRLIGMANSVAFSPAGQQTNSATAAIRRIGLARTRELAIAMLFGNPLQSKLPASLTQGLWVHALTMAAAAQEIARRQKYGKLGAAYLAGLVHDLGYMAEELCVPGALRQAAELSVADGITFEQAEEKVLGVNHGMLTKHLLVHWNAPAEIIAAIDDHHDLSINSDSLAAILFGAEKLARYIEVTEVLYGDVPPPFPGMSIDRDGLEFLFRQMLELTSEDVSLLADRIIDQVEPLRQCARAMHGMH